MPHERRLKPETCRELVMSYQQSYLKADRKEKGLLLDRLGQDTGYNRKYLCRLLRGRYTHHPGPRRRGRQYGAAVDDVLRVVFDAHDGICAERIHPNLLTMAEQLERHHELALTPEVRSQLRSISLSTVRRHWERLQQDEPRLLRRSGRPRNHLRDAVGMGHIPYNEPHPGHFEVDLVHHSGPAARGEFVYTLQMVDVTTGWSELRALLGRSRRVMAHAFDAILQRLPIPVIELHPDNGAEFFTGHLVHFWGERVPGLRWSRSRPYVKNDNRFVEQRNANLVRAYVGRDRLDTVEQTRALNELYSLIWLYFNFFQPVRRLVEKTTVMRAGRTRTLRRFDLARTPLDRLCLTGILSADRQAELLALREKTNPRALHKSIYDQIDRLFMLPGAESGVTEDVFETLTDLIP